MPKPACVFRAKAVEQGLPRYRREKPCIHGHNAERYTSNGQCVECALIHAEKLRAVRTPESRRVESAKYLAKNREVLKKRSKRYYRRNKSKYRAYGAAYRARKIQATPKWANLKAIEAIYAECRRLTKKTRKKHEVDHIIPLRGKHVCGLHVENNLQILTKKENRAKRNYYSIDG